MQIGNIFQIYDLPEGDKEKFESLYQGKGIKIERIISNGQSTPPGQWYDQPNDEFVVLLQGEASIEFQTGEINDLSTGDYLLIPAGLKHRVILTGKNPPCIWLAMHFESETKNDLKKHEF
mgnify:CR=1 FL=1